MKKYDVIRCENRQNGREDWIGELVADSREEAEMVASGQYECDSLHHLIVVETSDEPA